MAIHKYIRIHCPRCDKDTEFEPVLRYVDYNGIIPCWRCTTCNTVCPEYSFNKFISTGEITIGL